MHLAARRLALAFRARLRRIRRAARRATRRRPALELLAAFLALPAAPLPALTLYWDNNGATPGSSNIRDTWWPDAGSRLWWSTSAAGDVATQGWTPGSTAVFSAGTNATGYSLVDIGQGVNVAAIYVEEGSIELWGAFFSGYFYDLSAFDVASGADAILDATLRETSGPISFTKTGAGVLTIRAPNQTTGAFTVSGGTVNISHVGNLSSGDLTVNNGATLANSGILELNDRTVTVTGAGSTLSSVNYIEFADVGDVTVHIAAGGLVSSQSSVAFGIQAGITGTATVTGSGSHLTSGSQIHVGYHGIGNLTVESGGRVTPGTILELATYAGSTGTFNLNAGGTLAIGGADGIVKGAGTAHLNLGGGTLEVTGSSFTTSLPATLAAGTVSTIDTNGFDATLSGLLSGAGGLAKSGTGTLALPGPNNYTGGTTVNAGTLHLGSATSLGPSGNLTLNGGTLNLGGFHPTFDTVTFNGGTFSNGTLGLAGAFEVLTGSLSAPLGGAAALTKNGSGTFTLSGANSHAGRTTINGGTLRIAADTNLGTAPAGPTPGHLTLDGGALENTATFQLASNRGLLVGASGGRINTLAGATLAYDGVIAGSGPLEKSGAGTLRLGGANTFGGTLTVTDGTLSLDHADALAAAGVAVHGTLDFGPLPGATLGDLSGNGLVQLGSTTLSVGALGGSGAFDGVFTGAGGVVKTGSGTFTLTGENLHTGGTTVSAGTLVVSSVGKLGGGMVTVSGGTLAGSGNLSFDREVSLSGADSALTSTGYLEFGSVGSGSLTVSSGADVISGSSIAFGVLGSSVGSGLVTGAGSLLQAAGPLYLGYLGQGTLTVEDGGTVGAASLQLGTGGGSGIFHLNTGGTLQVGGASGITGSGSGAQLNLAGGTLRVTGSALSTGTAATLVSGTTSTIDTNGLGATLAGILSGSGSLTKTGAGNLTLSGANSYSGGTTVSAGSLTGDSTSLQGDITNHAALVFDQASAGTYAGNLSGTGSLTKTGAGTLTLTGTNSHSGGTTLSAGILTGDSTSLQGDIANHAALVFDQAATGTYAGNLSGTGSLAKIGAGNLTLSGSNTHSGGTTVSAGTLTGDTASIQGDIANHAALVFAQAATGTYSGNLSGSGSLTKTGPGSLTLSGANSYSGGTTISGGALVVASDARLGAASAPLAVTSGATLATGGDFRSNRAITVDGVGSHLANNGELIIGNAGTGSLVLTNHASASTYNLTLGFDGGIGALDISSGSTVTVGNVTDLGHPSGVLNLNTTGTLATAGLAGNGTFNLAGGTLRSTGAFTSDVPATLTHASTVDTNGFATTLSGHLSGTGSLTKIGAGNLTLTDANSYSGGTTVSGGALVVASDARLGAASAPLAVTSGATLATGGDFRSNRAITVDGVGSHLANNGELIIGNAGTGSLVLTNHASASTYNLTLGYNGGAGAIDIASGSTVTVGNITALGSGILNIHTGGTLATAGLAGNGAFNLAGGTLRSTGAFTSDVPATLTHASTVDTNGFATTLSGHLSGSGSLAKIGAGNLTLTGANSYSGGTTVSGGTLVLASAAPLGSGGLSVSGGTVAGSANLTLDKSVGVSGPGSALATVGYAEFGSAGAGSLTVSDGGTVTTGTSTAFGVLAGSQGVGSVTGAGSSLDADGFLYLGFYGTGTLSVGDGGTVSAAGIEMGSVGGGSGTIHLDQGGTLRVGASGIYPGSGSASLQLRGGTLRATTAQLTVSTPITLGADTTSTLDTDGFEASLGAAVSGSGSLAKSGAGRLTLSGSNTYTGATAVSAGTLTFAATSAFYGGAITPANAGKITVANDAVLGLAVGAANGFTPADFTVIATHALLGDHAMIGIDTSNAIGGVATWNNADFVTSSLHKVGAGTLRLSGTTTLSQNTHVLGGALGLANRTAFYGGEINAANAGKVTLADGTRLALEIGGADDFTVADLTIISTNAQVGAGAFIGLDTSNAVGGTVTWNDTDFAGTSLNKLGAGTLRLTGTTTLSQNIHVLGGTLGFANRTAFYGGEINAANAGKVTLADGTRLGLEIGGADDFTVADLAVVSTNAQVGAGAFIGFDTSNAIGGTVTWNDTDFAGTSLNKLGSGTLRLTGTTTLSQNTHVLGGTLDFADHDAFYGGAIDAANASHLIVHAGATARFSAGAPDAFSASALTTIASHAVFAPGAFLSLDTTGAPGGTFSWTVPNLSGVGVEKHGEGTLILSGSHNYAGGIRVTGGTLQLGEGDAIALGSASITNSSSLILNHSNNLEHFGPISGSGNLVKTGSGTLFLRVNNTYSGGTTVSDGRLSFFGINRLGSGPVLVNGTGWLESDHDFLVDRPITIDGPSARFTSAGYLDIGNTSFVVSGGARADLFSTTYADLGLSSGQTGQLTISGPGSVLATNAYIQIGLDHGSTGIINLVDGGTLSIGAADGLRKGLGSAIINLAGGTLQVAGSDFSTVLPATLAAGTTSGIDTNGLAATWSGVLSGSGSLAKTGAGTLTLANNNTYAGGTTVSAGTLTLGHTNALGSPLADLTLSGGTLDLGSFAPTVGTAIFDGGTFTNGNLNNASAFEVRTGSLAASLGGAASLAKTGPGDFTLSGTNTYTGGTTISAGTLVTTAVDQLGTGDITINGGTLTTANASFDRNVTVTGADATLAVSGYTEVGGIAPRSLTLADGGATSTTTTLAVGLQPFATGTVDVFGAGSRLDVGTTLFLGYIGHGTLTIADGGTVAAGSQVMLGFESSGTGTLNLNTGGTLEVGGANGIAVRSGTAHFNLNGGTLKVSDSDLTTSIPITLTHTSTLDTNGHDAVLSGVINGLGSLEKIGAGTLTLANDNTYAGSTTIRAGTVRIATDSALGVAPGFDAFGHLTLDGGTLATTADLTLDSHRRLTVGPSGGTLDVAAGTTLSYGAPMASATPVTKAGAGTLRLTAPDALGGSVDIAAGTLALVYDTGTGFHPGSSGIISGTGDLFIDLGANDSVTLSPFNTYTGSTTLAGGTLLLLADTSLGTAPATPTAGHLVFDGGGLRAEGSLALDAHRGIHLSAGGGTLDTQHHALTYGGVIAGPGALTKIGSGHLTLTGANTHSGGTTIAAGTLTATASALPGDVANQSALVFEQFADATFAGILSGAGSVTKFGPGNLTLTGDNTHTGVTTIFSGTLSIGAGGTTGKLGGDITNHAALVFNRSDDLTFTGVIDGPGSLTKSGAGNLTLSNGSATTGTITVAEGTLTIGSGSTTALAASTLTNNSNLTFNSSSDLTLATLSGTGGFTKTGSGTLTITHIDSTGDFTVSDGELVSNSPIDNRTVTVTGSTSTYTTGASDTRIGYFGTGSLTISNGATYALTQATNILAIGYDTSGSRGTVTVTGIGSNLTSDGVLGMGGGTLNVEEGATVTFNSPNLAYVGGATATVNIGSGGTLTLNSILLGANLGTTDTLNLNDGGTLVLGGANGPALMTSGNNALVNFAGGTLKSQGTHSLTVSANVHLADGTASAIDTNGQTGTVSGVLSGSGSLAKAGAGTLTLTGANTFTGGLSISAGTLALGADGSIATSSGVNLGTTASPGTFDLTAKTGGFGFGASQTLTGVGTVRLAPGQALTVAGTLAPGNSPGLLTVDGDLVLTGTSTTTMELGGLARGTDYDAHNVGGGLTFGGTLEVTLLNGFTPGAGNSFQLFNASSFGGGFAQLDLPDLAPGLSWDLDLLLGAGTLQVVGGAIPEPASFAGLLGAAGLLRSLTRRRRRA